MTETIIAILTAIGGLMTAAFKTFKFVKEGEKGCVLRFGKLNRVRDPGFIILIPFVEKLETIHVRETTTQLPKQTITLKDNYILNVSAVIVYKVIDPRKALYNISQVSRAVVDIAMTVLRHEFAKLSYSEVQDNFDDINSNLLKNLQELTKEWGVNFMHFRVSNLDPDSETTKLLQMVTKAREEAKANKLLLDKLILQRKTIADNNLPPIAYAAWFRSSAMPTVSTDDNGTKQVKEVLKAII